jgi:hypothetical protein
MYRDANRCRAISAAQPIDPKRGMMKRFDAEARQFEGHAGAHDAASLHVLDVLEGEAALAIMPAPTNCEVARMGLSKFDET